MYLIALAAVISGCTKEDQPEKDKTETEVQRKLSFSNTVENIDLHDSLQLTFNGEPQGLKDTIKVIWSSDNEDIVKVSPTGMVKGISPGEANVSVKSVDGVLSATLKINVRDIRVTSISFQNRYTIAYLNERTALPITITPANATNKELTWQTYQHDIATLEPTGYITPTKPGYILVTATHGSISDYTVVIPSIRNQEAMASYVNITAANPTRHNWEVYLANTGTEKITVTEVQLFTGSAYTEVAGTSNQTVVLEPNTANILANIPVTEAHENSLSFYSRVRIEATIGARPVYITIGKTRETVITNR